MVPCNISDARPGSVLALELISTAASSVGVMHRTHGPNTGSNPGGGQIPKKNNNKKGANIILLNNHLEYWE